MSRGLLRKADRITPIQARQFNLDQPLLLA
jgi:hypothetical protein